MWETVFRQDDVSINPTNNLHTRLQGPCSKWSRIIPFRCVSRFTGILCTMYICNLRLEESTGLLTRPRITRELIFLGDMEVLSSRERFIIRSMKFIMIYVTISHIRTMLNVTCFFVNYTRESYEDYYARLYASKVDRLKIRYTCRNFSCKKRKLFSNLRSFFYPSTECQRDRNAKTI